MVGVGWDLMIFLVFSNLHDSILFCSMRGGKHKREAGMWGCVGSACLWCLLLSCFAPNSGAPHSMAGPHRSQRSLAWRVKIPAHLPVQEISVNAPLEQELCPTVCPGSASRPLCRSLVTCPEPTLNLSAWEIRQKMLRLSVKASAVIWSTQMTCTPRQREMKAFRAGEHQQNL